MAEGNSKRFLNIVRAICTHLSAEIMQRLGHQISIKVDGNATYVTKDGTGHDYLSCDVLTEGDNRGCPYVFLKNEKDGRDKKPGQLWYLNCPPNCSIGATYDKLQKQLQEKP